MRYLAESSAAGSGSSLTWLWILLGAVVAVGVVALVLIARYVGRRPEIVGGWLIRPSTLTRRGRPCTTR